MTSRSALLGLGTVALVAVVIVGTRQATRRSSPPPRPPPAAVVRAELAGSPPALAALHAQAGELLDGGATALRSRLGALRGYPVVVNKWASWCGPCRTEFPVLAGVSAALGRRVAFLGIDSGDASGDAARFLRRHPVSYPSYADRTGRLGSDVMLSSVFPVTAFYDASGRRTFIHQGGFSSVAELERDIARYAEAA